MEGMAESVRKLAEGDLGADYALVDGPHLPKTLSVAGQAVVKGDARCACIAAASVLAKVTRDRLMVEMDRVYPQYGFAQHKGTQRAARLACLGGQSWGAAAADGLPTPVTHAGYGVRAHVAAIYEHGPSPEHRRTFAPVKHMLAAAAAAGEEDDEKAGEPVAGKRRQRRRARGEQGVPAATGRAQASKEARGSPGAEGSEGDPTGRRVRRRRP